LRSNIYKTDGATFPHHYYVPDKLISLLDKRVNKSIIDFGCGNGFITSKIIERGFNIFGVDESESGIKIASEKYPGHFYLQDISKSLMPDELEDKIFDTIIASEVIEHLYAPNKFLEYCKNLLLKNGGGEIIITVPYHGYLKNILLSIFNKWDFHHTVTWDGGHIKFYSKNTLIQMLKDNGFTPTNFIGCGRLPLLWKSMIVKAELK
jgi:2-polyprenyl-3-methyl-5-hydroxy-6-metoxy-1,4-benzoquinol methylase